MTAVPITFVLHDAGETKALQPVLRQLDSRHVPYAILADGVAAQLTAQDPHRVTLPEDIVQLSGAAREEAEVNLTEAIHAPTVVVGLVSRFQQFWAEWFQRRGSTVVGFDDAFTATDATEPSSRFKGLLSALITPTPGLASYFKPRFPGLPIFPLGQPVLETIVERMAQVDTAALRRQLGLAPAQQVITWVGGYGPGYEQAFQRFAGWLNQHPEYFGLISVHPSQSGELEKAVLADYSLRDRTGFQPEPWDGMDSVAIADRVAGHHSTLLVQAAALGKPVDWLNPASPKPNDFVPNATQNITYYLLKQIGGFPN